MPRHRLIEKLNKSLRGKLTLISAPAGFGKTTLVMEWVHSEEAPVVHPNNVAWLSLDENDNDPARFLSYSVAALQRVDNDVGHTALDLLRSPQPPPMEALVAPLINDIVASESRFVLVLDDYHLITARPIHEALAFLLHNMPPNAHVVLIARADPPLSLSRLRAQGQMTELRTDDLRFTASEAGAFLCYALELNLSAEEVATLGARTEGWIAGLQLAALSLQGRPDTAAFISEFDGSQRHVMDYLSEEVFRQQPAQIRDFLSQTSILERLTASLCEAVTGHRDSQSTLTHLERANLFLAPLDDRREWYRYHYLFAEFLRRELDEERRGKLHSKAARWFEDRGLMPEAVEHALAARDLDEAARLVRQAARTVFQSGEQQTVRGWLDELPDELVRSDGELAMYKGWVLFAMGRITEAASYAASAESRLSSEASPLQRGRLLALRAWISLHLKEAKTARHLAEQALRLVSEEDAAFRSMTLTVLGEAHDMAGDAAAAVEAYRDAAHTGWTLGNSLAYMMATLHLAVALNDAGRRREAVQVCDRAMVSASTDTRDSRPLLIDVLRLASGALCYEANRLAEAREQLQAGLRTCRRLGLGGAGLYGQHILAQILLTAGEWETALEVSREVYEGARRQQSPNYTDWAGAFEARVYLKRGDIPAAARWAERENLSPSGKPLSWREPVYFTYARLLLAQDRPDEAEVLLENVENTVRRGSRRRALISVRLLQALARQALGRGSRALDLLREALSLAAPEGYVRAFLDEDRSIQDLLRRVLPELEGATALGFVDRVLTASGAGASSSRPHELPDPLTGRELEILRLIAAGRSNPEIARMLYLSPNTVKWHVKNLYGKLNANSRVEAVARARELRLV